MSDAPRDIGSSDPRHGAGGEELDGLLREWHRQNAARAAAGRETLMARLRAESTQAPSSAPSLNLPPLIDDELKASLRARDSRDARTPGSTIVVRRFSMIRTWSAAAAAIILAGVLPFLFISRDGNQNGPFLSNGTLPGGGTMKNASFEGYLLCPEGGRLDARDDQGVILGPCALKHTDVVVDVSGFLTRVTVTQKYHNPHAVKIEALYTFPLSERSAVDRMTMTVGNRVIEGQVKEKAEARRIYEEAKANNRIASLLEQERPNIFTQSIANIEPGVDIDITISYVETTKQVGGVFEFDFPTTITPRYIPGEPITGDNVPPPRPNLRRRYGLVLLAPATVSQLGPVDIQARGQLSEADLSMMLRRAEPVQAFAPAAPLWYTFRAAYQDGSAEFGQIYTDGTGTLNGRCFAVPEHALPGHAAEAGVNATPGAPFSPDTNRVPDASRITPMPVHPSTRAGHDISILVNISTGGPDLGDISSPLHEIVTDRRAGGTAHVRLKSASDIPNRDFVLKWRQATGTVEPAVFTSNTDNGNFFAVQLVPPPAETEDALNAIAVPREMVFVLDVSGSMKGRPIEKAKEVLDRALRVLRPGDTFNIVRFNNSLATLWSEPRQATPQNLDEARAFYNQEIGGGGTQMYPAIQAAYRAGGAAGAPVVRGVTPMDLANLPADGRQVTIDAEFNQASIAVLPPEVQRLRPDVVLWKLRASPSVEIDMPMFTNVPSRDRAVGAGFYRFTGRWETLDGQRIFSVRDAQVLSKIQGGANPFRMIVFLTDGIIGNENEVIAEIQANQSRAAIFPFAIGNSPNRYLLDSMARFGRGEVEYVYETTNADEVINRFSSRIQTPVLTNIKVEFSPGLNVIDVLTALGGGGAGVSNINAIPDLFDVKPLTIIGRYNQPGAGTVTISGTTASGPYQRVVALNLPAPQPHQPRAEQAGADLNHIPTIIAIPNLSRESISTLWARAKVEAITGQDLRGVLSGNVNPSVRSQIITLGETFNLVTQYTSFVAVDRLRVTVGGKPRLVHIPIELTAGTDFTGFFGGQPAATWNDDQALLDLDGETIQRYRFVPTPTNDGYTLLGMDMFGEAQSTLGDSAVGFGATRELAETLKTVDASASAGALQAPASAPGSPPKPEPTTGSPSRESQPGRASEGRPENRGERPAVAAAPREPSGGEKASKERKDEYKRASDPGQPGDASGDKKPKADQAAGAPPAPAREELGRSGGRGAEPARTEAKPGEQAPPRPPSPPPAPAAPAAAPSPAPVNQPMPSLSASREPVRDLSAGVRAAESEMVALRGIEAIEGRQRIDMTPGNFVGYIATDESRLNSLATIDPARAQQTGRMLHLYFDTLQLGIPAGDVGPAGPGGERTSHDRGAAPGAPATQRVVLAEHVIIRIAALDQAGKHEQANALATALAEALPQSAPAVEVGRVFADASITPEDRVRILDEQAKAARERLEAMIREAKLKRRLDPALRTPDPSSLPIVDGGVLVSILVEDVNSANTLVAAGLKVESSDTQAKVIIGIAPLDKLAVIALVDGVRKVEPTR